MKQTEFRITLPMTVEEYQVAQLYAVAEASKNETGGGEGVEVIQNEPYDNVPLLGGKFTKGQYTNKVYHLESKVPGIVRTLAPKGSLELKEEAWNAYPYCRTVLTNPGYMKDNFHIIIETYHLPDNGNSENVHQLPADKWKNVEVVKIDIANDPMANADYNKEHDPKLYKSEKTGRGPLTGNWKDTVKPVMTCYKLVTILFKWWGLQNRMESFIISTERRLFLKFHRELFCWTDKWHGMTMEDIRALEDKTKGELDEQRQTGEARGLKSLD